MIRTYFTVQDTYGLDHLMAEDKRTLCGFAVNGGDRLYGYTMGAPDDNSDDGPSVWDDDECRVCLMHLNRVRP